MIFSLRLTALVALISYGAVAQAQVTYTNNLAAPSNTPITNSNTALQTFTGFSNITNMTWSVKNVSGGTDSATFNAYIGQWNTTSNSLVGSLTAFGTTNLSTGSIASGASTNLSFTDTWNAPDAGLTYALLLSYSGGPGSTAFGANFSTSNFGDDFFGSGGVGSKGTAASLGSFLTDLGTSGGLSPNLGQSYSMSVTGTLAAVPEPQTAAAVFAGVFVAGLVGRRVWQRRKSVAEPLAA